MIHYSDNIQTLIDKCGDEWTQYYMAFSSTKIDETNKSFIEHVRARACAMTEALETVTGESCYYSLTHGEMRVCKEDEQ